MADEPQNIDLAFAEAMREIGGVRPIEISRSVNSTDNADIVFEKWNLIAEVKTLMLDQSKSDSFQRELNALYGKWIRSGRVPPSSGLIQLNTHDLPEACAIELLEMFTRRIKGIVKKANRQIKALKSSLNMPTARGLLVLCNSGNVSMAPDALLWALHRATARQFTTTTWIIYMTHDLKVQLPGYAEPADLFIGARREGGQPMPAEIFAAIQDAWMSHRSKGQIVKVYAASDPSLLFDVKHVRPSADT